MSQRGGEGAFYQGSRLLNPLTGVTGLSIDQLNFLVCQLVALGLGFPFRKYADPRTTSPMVRHAIEVLLGLALMVFCFGSQFWHLLAHATLGYILMQFTNKKWMPIVVFVFALGYLSVCHIYRQILDYGGYTLDITGPLMISVQKLTSLAYSLHDGMYRKPEELSENQKKFAVKKVPDILTFSSYILSFHGVMCGPLAFFNDYIAFIDGSCYQVANPGSNNSELVEQPSPVGTLVEKVVPTLILGILMMLEPYVAPWDVLFEDNFLYHTTFVWRTFYLFLTTSMHRPRYYFAWKLGEMVNNANGLGFNGYDDKGNEKWDMLNNVNIYLLETSTTLRDNIGNWNIITTHWLRQVVYDRAPVSVRTWAVFAISAFWHGFYPGYYITFLTGALLTEAARTVRRHVRPYFLQSDRHKFFYDCVTCFFVRIVNAYLVAPFMLLEFLPGLRLYSAMYWYFHIGSIAVIVFFRFFRPPAKSKGDKSN